MSSVGGYAWNKSKESKLDPFSFRLFLHSRDLRIYLRVQGGRGEIVRGEASLIDVLGGGVVQVCELEQFTE